MKDLPNIFKESVKNLHNNNSLGTQSTKYKCHKSCVNDSQHIYDNTTIQKLTEIFNFDYLIKDCKPKNNDNVVSTTHANSIANSDDLPHYTYNFNQKRHIKYDENADGFLYVPLETIFSPVYPLDLPPPRSDDDIVPVSSSVSSFQNQSQPQYQTNDHNKLQFLNSEKQLLLHDLFSGDIYDN